MRAGWVLLALIGSLLESRAGAQQSLPPQASIRSVSGQFLIQDQRGAGVSLIAGRYATNADYIVLEPMLLAVSCDRIRQEVWTELGVSGPWRGRICVNLRDAQFRDSGITIGSDRFRDGWLYSLTLPDLASRETYLRAVVRVVLMELANRESAGRQAEIPAWLCEGLSRDVLAAKGIEVMLPPPRKVVNGLGLVSTNVVLRKADPVNSIREKLRSSAPLTFEQLCWPREDRMNGAAGEMYALSSQLFLDELLRLPDGKAHARRMLAELPRYYNWQFAFLNAFQTDFTRLLDVEKWWSLRLATFLGGGGDSPERGPDGKELDDILSPEVELRSDPNQLPMEGRVNLQTIIQQWPVEKQEPLLLERLRALELLRLHASPELGRLASDYSAAINKYLGQARKKRGLIQRLLPTEPDPNGREQTVLRLDELDRRRLGSKDKTLARKE